MYVTNFTFDVLNINPEVLQPGETSAVSYFACHVTFKKGEILMENGVVRDNTTPYDTCIVGDNLVVVNCRVEACPQIPFFKIGRAVGTFVCYNTTSERIRCLWGYIPPGCKGWCWANGFTCPEKINAMASFDGDVVRIFGEI